MTNPTDRELLEMAAKACGITGIPMELAGGDPALYVRDNALGIWAPLIDDADAFRLAVRLELDIMHRVVGGERVEVLAPGGPKVIEYHSGETDAATRRAIVRAAAALGEKQS